MPRVTPGRHRSTRPSASRPPVHSPYRDTARYPKPEQLGTKRHCTRIRGESHRRYPAMSRSPHRRGPSRCRSSAAASRSGVNRPNPSSAKANEWNGPGSVAPPHAAAHALHGPPGSQDAASGAPHPA